MQGIIELEAKELALSLLGSKAPVEWFYHSISHQE